jgi:hypothetical protein
MAQPGATRADVNDIHLPHAQVLQLLATTPSASCIGQTPPKHHPDTA